jgi:O-antigen ligase
MRVWQGWLALTLAMALLFVWSIPGTIALRYLLMLAALLLLVSPGSSALAGNSRAHVWPTGLFALLSVWLVIQALLVSAETAWALRELRSQWLTAGVALVIGAGLAARGRAGHAPAAATTALMAVLMLQALIAIGQAVVHWFRTGELLRQVVPLTGGKLEMSYLLTILATALGSDLLCRAVGRRHLLRLPTAIVVLALLLTLLSAYLAGARNGTAVMLMVFVVIAVLFANDRVRAEGGGRRAALGGAVLMCVIGFFAYAAVKADSRWAVFEESARLGWDIDGNRAWIDGVSSLPQLASGEQADGSAYQRAAFVHAGLRLVAEHPLGVGYGRNAFAHGLRQSQKAAVGHTHSGLLDLAIGGGVPAAVLWLLLTGSLAAIGARRYFRDGDPHGLFLLLLVTGYLARMLLDSVSRDHMLQMFLFLVGYLLVRSAPPQPATAESPEMLPSR